MRGEAIKDEKSQDDGRPRKPYCIKARKNQSFTVTRYRAGAPSDNPTFLTQRERVLDGMRKAGVPDG